MDFNIRKINKIYLTIFFLLIIILLFYYFQNLSEEDKKNSLRPLTVNLLTSVHPSLPWSFKPIKPKLFIKPGRCLAEQTAVKAPGSPNIITF